MNNTTTSRIETYSAEIFIHKWIMLNGLAFQFESPIKDPYAAITKFSKLLNEFVEKDIPFVIANEQHGQNT